MGEIQSKKLVKDYGFSFIRVLNQTSKQISKQLDISEKLATVLQQGWKATLGYNFLEVFLRNAGFTFSQIIFSYKIIFYFTNYIYNCISNS